jgi:hypothetical protein
LIIMKTCTINTFFFEWTKQKDKRKTHLLSFWILDSLELLERFGF